ncbi:hypothetical protein E2320_015440, partial [Naja naja]
MHTSG